MRVEILGNEREMFASCCDWQTVISPGQNTVLSHPQTITFKLKTEPASKESIIFVLVWNKQYFCFYKHITVQSLVTSSIRSKYLLCLFFSNQSLFQPQIMI